MPYNVKIELESLLKEINQVVRASSIYLFGSYAYGEPTEDSDLDICIVTDDKSKRKVEIMKLIRKAIAKVQNMPVDLLIYYSIAHFFHKSTIFSFIFLSIIPTIYFLSYFQFL